MLDRVVNGEQALSLMEREGLTQEQRERMLLTARTYGLVNFNLPVEDVVGKKAVGRTMGLKYNEAKKRYTVGDWFFLEGK